MTHTGHGLRLLIVLCLPGLLWSTDPDTWVPARWQGGPLELELRAQSKTLPAAGPARAALENWYDPTTLRLLDGSPINCLLVTWSGGADRELERRQQRLVKSYTAEAHRRGTAVLGLVYPGSDASEASAAAADAALDGLVLEGDLPGEFAAQAAGGLAAAGSRALVFPILRDAPSARGATGPVVAVEGVSPSARNLADMGIRSAPSSEPWIESNIWLVRSFRLRPAWHPVWISYQPETASAAEYAQFVADAAVAGGRWIVAPDDKLRAGLWSRDAGALEAWQRIAALLRFAGQHADWCAWAPYGNLAVVIDPAAPEAGMMDESLKLVTRRQTQYRIIARPQLTGASLAGFQAVLATGLAPLSDGERGILRGFAESGGLVITGPSWGAPAAEQPYVEIPVGKGRLVVYRDPDPESVARDLRDLLSDGVRGVTAFNVPSVIVYASGGGSGRVLVQLLNYSRFAAEAITIRVRGEFDSARLFTPGADPLNLAVQRREGFTDVAIDKLALWGMLLLE